MYRQDHAVCLDDEKRHVSSTMLCDGCTARSNDLAGSPWEARDARQLVSAALRLVQHRLRHVEERKAPER